MSFEMRVKKYLVGILICITFLSLLFGWSYEGHRYINREAVKLLPKEMKNFSVYTLYLSSHSIDADEWKKFVPNEKQRHFFDIDYYDQYPFEKVPRKYEEISEQYGRNTVLAYGTLPWTIVEFLEMTTTLMKSSVTFSYALLSAAALGHYVADAHQPLHTTLNYDGQYTDNHGIHFRYEWYMLDRFIDQIPPVRKDIIYVKDPLDFVFDFIITTYSGIDTILDADTKYFKKHFISDPEKYYELLWNDTKKLTIDQIHNAIVNVASLWYTAWVNAGRPKIPKIHPREFKTIKTVKDYDKFRQIAERYRKKK